MPGRKEWFLNGLGILITAIFLFPVYWMVVTAFKTGAELFQTPPSLWPETFQILRFFKRYLQKGSPNIL